MGRNRPVASITLHDQSFQSGGHSARRWQVLHEQGHAPSPSEERQLHDPRKFLPKLQRDSPTRALREEAEAHG